METLFYQRNLPHIQPTEAVFFVTTRLVCSLPKHVIEQLKEEHNHALKKLQHLEAELVQKFTLEQHKRYFARIDAALDKGSHGASWLSRPKIAELVKEAIHNRHGTEYNLIAYCLMSNHYHLVIDTRRTGKSERRLYQILHSLNRYTAREANKILGRTGQFWFGENYDHVVRDEVELKRVVNYVLQNPVKAGLAENWQDWPYSYVDEEYL